MSLLNKSISHEIPPFGQRREFLYLPLPKGDMEVGSQESVVSFPAAYCLLFTAAFTFGGTGVSLKLSKEYK